MMMIMKKVLKTQRIKLLYRIVPDIYKLICNILSHAHHLKFFNTQLLYNTDSKINCFLIT